MGSSNISIHRSFLLSSQCPHKRVLQNPARGSIIWEWTSWELRASEESRDSAHSAGRVSQHPHFSQPPAPSNAWCPCVQSQCGSTCLKGNCRSWEVTWLFGKSPAGLGKSPGAKYLGSNSLFCKFSNSSLVSPAPWPSEVPGVSDSWAFWRYGATWCLSTLPLLALSLAEQAEATAVPFLHLLFHLPLCDISCLLQSLLPFLLSFWFIPFLLSC